MTIKELFKLREEVSGLISESSMCVVETKTLIGLAEALHEHINLRTYFETEVTK